MMRRIVLLATAFALSTVCCYSQSSKIDDCKSIRDNAARLSCYDAFMPPETDNQQEYKAMTVNDVYLDWNALVGRKVSVRGKFTDMSSVAAITILTEGGWFSSIFRALLAPVALLSLDAWVVLLHCAELFSPTTVPPLGLTRIGFQKNDACRSVASQTIHAMIIKNIAIIGVAMMAAFRLASLTFPDRMKALMWSRPSFPVQLAIGIRTGNAAKRCSALSVVKARRATRARDGIGSCCISWNRSAKRRALSKCSGVSFAGDTNAISPLLNQTVDVLAQAAGYRTTRARTTCNGLQS